MSKSERLRSRVRRRPYCWEPPLLRDLGDGLFFKLLVLWIRDARSDDSFESTVLIDVFVEQRILFDLFPGCRVGEKFDDSFAWTIHGPIGKQAAPGMLHRGVRILIRSDLQSAASRLLTHRDGGTRFAPKILAADLQVKNVNRDMRDFGG